MVLPAPTDTILIDITGDTTGFVTGDPPNDATGDLDATVEFRNPNWTLLTTTWEISDDPGIGTATINPFTGEWVYTVDPAEFAALDDGEFTTDSFVVEVTALALNPGGQLQTETALQTVTIAIEGVCFAAGTLIESEGGPVPVETLQAGDRVATLDNGFQPVRWIESSDQSLPKLRNNPKLWPVRIRAGALGPDCPRRDLFVSQQHRILVGGAQVEMLFGTDEVLASAKSLCHLSGIEICAPTDSLTYVHLLLDRHEILEAEGAPAESLFLGEEALFSLTSEALQELADIFPQTTVRGRCIFGQAARKILREKEALVLS